eukprot:6466794-Amphidinium_carterae.3
MDPSICGWCETSGEPMSSPQITRSYAARKSTKTTAMDWSRCSAKQCICSITACAASGPAQLPIANWLSGNSPINLA